MYSVLSSGGHELAGITYEVTQLRHTLLEQSMGQDAIVEAQDRLGLLINVAQDAIVGPDPDPELIGKLLEVSRQESESQLSMRKNEIWDPIRNIVVDGFRTVEVAPNVLKLCNFVKEPTSELSMIWLGAQAIDDTIALTKKQKWLSPRPGTPSEYPLSIGPEDQEIVRSSIDHLYVARDALRSQLL